MIDVTALETCRLSNDNCATRDVQQEAPRFKIAVSFVDQIANVVDVKGCL